MDIFSGAIQAIRDGIDPLVVIILVLICIVVAQLREIIKLQAAGNEKIDSLGDKVDTHGRHQTARMEEIRKFMLSWWERFGPMR